MNHRQKIIGICLLWSCLLATVGVLVFFTQGKQGAAHEKLRHSTMFVQDFNIAVRLMGGTESSLRAFLLTGDDKYLVEFRQSEVLLDQRLSEYHEEFRNFPEKVARIARLKELEKKWFREFALPQIAAMKSRANSENISTAKFPGVKLAKADEITGSFNLAAFEALAEESLSDEAQTQAFKRVRLWLAIGIPFCIFLGLVVTAFAIRSTYGVVNELTQSFVSASSTLGNAARMLLADSTALALSNEETSGSTQSTATAIADIKTVTGSNSAASSLALNTTKRCLELAVNGQRFATDVRVGILDISRESEKMRIAVEANNEKLARISSFMGQINLKTSVINDIVFLTKLLSFNAAIEAERAGQHGAGFAVVADEIGRLARMSGAAAAEISSLLTDSSSQVQAIIKETTTSMDRTTSEIKRSIAAGTNLSDQGQALITDLLQNVGSVYELMNNICHSCQEQETDMGKVTQAILEIESAVQQQCTLAKRYVGTATQLKNETELIDEQVLTRNKLFG